MSYWLFKSVVASSLLYQNRQLSHIRSSNEEIERVLKQALNEQALLAFIKEKIYTIRKGLEVALKKVGQNPHQAFFFSVTVQDFFRANNITTASFPEIADKVFFDGALEAAMNVKSASEALLDEGQRHAVQTYIMAKQCVWGCADSTDTGKKDIEQLNAYE